jgi:hypothetical protein
LRVWVLLEVCAEVLRWVALEVCAETLRLVALEVCAAASRTQAPRRSSSRPASRQASEAEGLGLRAGAERGLGTTEDGTGWWDEGCGRWEIRLCGVSRQDGEGLRSDDEIRA